MSLKLIQASPEDAGIMAAILKDWVTETPWMPDLHTLDDTCDFCLKIVPDTLIARLDLRNVGFMTRREEEISCFYLEEGARGQGVGSALLQEAQRARPRLRLWTFAANEDAQRFYARHGFVEIGRTEGDNDEGLPDVRMEWRRG